MSDSAQLYRHFDSEGALLYVGVSQNASHRLEQHCSGSKWFAAIGSITIEKFSTRAAAINAERIAIRDEKPKYNRQSLPPTSPAPVPNGMTNAEYRQVIARLGLTQDAAADLLCIHKRTSCGFANDRAVPEIYARFLRLILRTGVKVEDVS